MYCLASTIRLRTLEGNGSCWAFNIATGDHFELNHTGFSLLREIEAGTHLSEIAAALAAEYNVSLPDAETDIHEALGAFERDGLITKEKAP